MSDFRIKRAPIPELKSGEFLLETLYLSLDPYMRWRMSAAKSYAEPVPIGGVMVGGTVARVRPSGDPGWREGDVVLSGFGCQNFAVSDGEGLRRLDPGLVPPSTALGIRGMTGFTAYAGLLTIGRPGKEETAVVAAASGAVGSVVGQIARIEGARAVGVTTVPENARTCETNSNSTPLSTVMRRILP